jgi:hypothetical protein
MQHPTTGPSIASYGIDDRLDRPDEGAVEVVLALSDGQRPWCFFFTPERMSLVGDLVEGTQVRMHLGVKHMIVVAELTRDIIDRVLHELEAKGLLLEHTHPFGEGAASSNAAMDRPRVERSDKLKVGRRGAGN